MERFRAFVFSLLLLVCVSSAVAQLPAITDSAQAQVGYSDTTTAEIEAPISGEAPDASVSSVPMMQQYVYQGTMDWDTLSESLQTHFGDFFVAYKIWEEFLFPFQGYVFLSKVFEATLWDYLLKLLPMLLLFFYLRARFRRASAALAATNAAASFSQSLPTLQRDLEWGMWVLLLGVFFSSPYLLLPGVILSLWKGVQWWRLYKYQQKNHDDSHTALRP